MTKKIPPDFSDIEDKYKRKVDVKSERAVRYDSHILTKRKTGHTSTYPAGVITDVKFS